MDKTVVKQLEERYTNIVNECMEAVEECQNLSYPFFQAAMCGIMRATTKKLEAFHAYLESILGKSKSEMEVK